MTRFRLPWPLSLAQSTLGLLTIWVALIPWSGFTESSSRTLVPLAALGLLLALIGGLARSRVSSVWLLTALTTAVAGVFVVLVGAGHAPSLSSPGDFLGALADARESAQTY